MSLASLWLKSSKLSTSEKLEIKKLTNQEQEFYFPNKTMIFGTGGVRGVMGMGTLKMNRFTYANLTQALARYLTAHYGANKQVVIGHDNRLNAKEFALVVAKVFSSFKMKVLLFEHNQLMPTPIVSYAIRQTKSVGGVIITASHNPKEYNGFKAYGADGCQVLPNATKEIDKYMCASNKLLDFTYAPNVAYISYLNTKSLLRKYFKDVQQALVNKSIIKKQKKYPIVLTAHHGTACKLLPLFLKSLRFNIKPVQKQMFPNPNFINSKNLNPEDIKSFGLSFKYAQKIGAKICIGVDPDADRMAICIKRHNEWYPLTGNEMGIIYTYYILKHKRFMKTPYILSTYVSTYLIDKIAKRYKAIVYRTATGFKWMGAKMTNIGNKQQFVVAFEESIGALNTTINRDKDSFGASALALEIYDYLQQNGKDFVDYLQQEIYPQFGYCFSKTDSFTIKGFNWQKLVLQKMKKLKSFHAKKILGYRLLRNVWNKQGDCLEWHLGNGNWIKFRMSGTEPKFKVYYDLYGNSTNALVSQYNQLRFFLAKLLGV